MTAMVVRLGFVIVLLAVPQWAADHLSPAAQAWMLWATAAVLLVTTSLDGLRGGQ